MAKYGPGGSKGAQTTGLQPIRRTPKSGGIPIGGRIKKMGPSRIPSANPSRWTVAMIKARGIP